METVEIKKENAIKAYEEAGLKTKKVLENLFGKKVLLKNVTERIKTIDDVLEDNNITMEEINEMFTNAPEHLKYQYLAELLVKSLNEGCTPDWDNGKWDKYFPRFVMSPSGFRFSDYGLWAASSAVGSRLCFKSSDLAIYAGKQFTDLYKQFMIIK